VILLDSAKMGWVFSQSEVNQRIQGGRWRRAAVDGQYKINAPFPNSNRFNSPGQLVNLFDLNGPAH
jgi:hypothetical protein